MTLEKILFKFFAPLHSNTLAKITVQYGRGQTDSLTTDHISNIISETK